MNPINHEPQREILELFQRAETPEQFAEAFAAVEALSMEESKPRPMAPEDHNRFACGRWTRACS